jgi:N-methylhydantoinase A
MLEVDPAEVHQLLAGLADRAKKELKEEGFADSDIAINYFLDLRYAGQGYELTVPIDRPDLNRAALAETRKRFDVIHEQLTGHGAPDQAVEIVNYRVTGTGKVEMFDLPRYPAANTDVAVAKTGVRPMFFAALGSKPVDCAVYDRAKLGPGHKLNGPAVIEQFDATVVVHPEQQCRVDALNNLLIERKENGHGH